MAQKKKKLSSNATHLQLKTRQPFNQATDQFRLAQGKTFCPTWSLPVHSAGTLAAVYSLRPVPLGSRIHLFTAEYRWRELCVELTVKLDFMSLVVYIPNLAWPTSVKSSVHQYVDPSARKSLQKQVRTI